MATNPDPTLAPATSSTTTSTQTSIGNPRDIQGILALSVVGGTFGVAVVAIVTGVANAVSVLASLLPLAGTIVGFYFGQKSQQ
jgi:hypothetical protein